MKNHDTPNRAAKAVAVIALFASLPLSADDWPSFRWPSVGLFATPESVVWAPKIDVFERDNRLVTRVDLPGLKKEDVSVEVTDGHLALSGERKREAEEKQGNFYRSEREYGSFYRAVPLPEGVKLEDVKATFSDGVLEVSVPLPAIAGPTSPSPERPWHVAHAPSHVAFPSASGSCCAARVDS